VDPHRQSDLIESEEPNVMKSSTDRLEPIVLAPYTEIAEPKRLKDLIESELPTRTLSRIDMQELILHTPYTEMELPNRPKLRSDNTEPRLMKSSALMEDPKRAMP
jgi:hypothetical protein